MTFYHITNLIYEVKYYQDWPTWHNTASGNFIQFLNFSNFIKISICTSSSIFCLFCFCIVFFCCMTHYYKVGSWKQQLFISLQIWISEPRHRFAVSCAQGLTAMMSEVPHLCSFLEAVRKNWLPGSLRLLTAFISRRLWDWCLCSLLYGSWGRSQKLEAAFPSRNMAASVFKARNGKPLSCF